jgi:hypothetical protein
MVKWCVSKVSIGIVDARLLWVLFHPISIPVVAKQCSPDCAIEKIFSPGVTASLSCILKKLRQIVFRVIAICCNELNLSIEILSFKMFCAFLDLTPKKHIEGLSEV